MSSIYSPRLRTSFLSMLIGNVFSAALGAATMLAGIRLLSPMEWASAAIIVGLGPALGVALSLGSVTYMVRELSVEPLRSVRESTYVRFLVRRAVVALCVVGLGYAVLSFASSVYGWVAVLAGVRFLRAGVSTLMSAERRFSQLSVLNVLEKLTALTAILGSQVLQHYITPVTMGLAFASSYLLFATLTLLVERPGFRGQGVFRSAMTPWRIWRGSGAFGVASLGGPIQQADVSVLSFVADAYQAGILAAGSRLTGGLNVVGSALGSVVIPYFAGGQVIAVARKRRRAPALAMIFALVLFMTAAGTTAFWVPVILGAEYATASFVISMYVALAFFLTLMQPLLALLQAWGEERTAMWIALAQSSLSIASIAVLGGLGGAEGAAIGQTIVAFLALLVLCYVARSLAAKRA